MLLGSLSACGDPTPSKYPSQEIYVQDTTLGSGDLFEYACIDRRSSLANTASVARARISFPLIGTVEVANKTPASCRAGNPGSPSQWVLEEPPGIGTRQGVQVQEALRLRTSEKAGNPVLRRWDDRGRGHFPSWGLHRDGQEERRHRHSTETRKTTKKYTVPVEAIGEGKAADFFVRPGDTCSFLGVSGEVEQSQRLPVRLTSWRDRSAVAFCLGALAVGVLGLGGAPRWAAVTSAAFAVAGATCFSLARRSLRSELVTFLLVAPRSPCSSVCLCRSAWFTFFRRENWLWPGTTQGR